MRRPAALLAALLAMAATPVAAVTCEDTSFADASFTICTVDATTEKLHLFHSDANGQPFGDFRALEASLDAETLAFAMNAGMYHQDRSPVGLYMEKGQIVSAIVTSDGPGNFGLLPNGVLCLTETSAQIYESLDYVARSPNCRDASQSGPMLVINGDLHPRLLPDGTSRYIRNGVGTSADGSTAIFAIANEPVNFHTFGRLFRDHLSLPNALYFDGKISRLYAPQLNRADPGFRLGPMIGVVE